MCCSYSSSSFKENAQRSLPAAWCVGHHHPLPSPCCPAIHSSTRARSSAGQARSGGAGCQAGCSPPQVGPAWATSACACEPHAEGATSKAPASRGTACAAAHSLTSPASSFVAVQPVGHGRGSCAGGGRHQPRVRGRVIVQHAQVNNLLSVCCLSIEKPDSMCAHPHACHAGPEAPRHRTHCHSCAGPCPAGHPAHGQLP